MPTKTPLSSNSLDFYAGYGYIRPFSSTVYGVNYQSVSNINATASIQDYFNKNFGLEIAGEYFSGPSPRGEFGQCEPGCADRDAAYTTAEIGPTVRFPVGRFVPFLHLLGGAAKVRGPYLQPLTWGEGATGGGGADYILPILHNHLALRGEANMQYMHVDFGPQSVTGAPGGVGDIKAFKASGGVVLRLGIEPPPVPVALACTVDPAAVFPGDPVMLTETATGLNPKRTPVYTASSTGGTLSPSGSTGTIATAGLAPGSYTVAGTVTDGKKPWETASCNASFTVKAFEPPTLTCSASPSTLTAGDTATITANGMSPQNRPLTYTYSSTAGQIAGTGNTVTLATAGLAPGSIAITCNVADDHGLTATATAAVTVEPQATQPKPVSTPLCSISFDRDTKRPTRVDNEGKACLDDLALALQRSTDAVLDVVGNAAPDEKDGSVKAAERAVNTKDYLVKEKGIDAGRVAVFTGTDGTKTVTTALIPSGAASVTATPVDETAVKPIPRKPLGTRKHHHHKQ